MRNTTIMGLAAALAILVILFVVSRLLPGKAPTAPQKPQVATAEQIAAQAAKVGPGFLGTATIGKWDLNCAKEPLHTGSAAEQGTPAAPANNAQGANGTINATPANTPAKPPEITFGRCRSSLIVRNRANKNAVALIAVFRLIDKAQEVALILHTPPVVKPGTKVIVALAEKQVISLPVTNCEKGQCIALGILRPDVYRQLVSRPKLAVVVPLQANGQRMIIPLTTSGLPQSVEAMRRAG